MSPVSADIESALSSLRGGTTQVCKDSLYCGIKPVQAQTNPTESPPIPMFNPKLDGPVLHAPKTMEMQTSAGKIHLVLEPSLAPKNASQMYKLFKAGAFDGTMLTRYEPNFVLQTALAETKNMPEARVPANVLAMFRRLPLEVDLQKSGQGLHKKWALSMAHGDDPNSAITSFSILLNDAPHLDHKFTVFGHVLTDQETIHTLARIENQWSQRHPFIRSVRDIQTSLANSTIK